LIRLTRSWGGRNHSHEGTTPHEQMTRLLREGEKLLAQDKPVDEVARHLQIAESTWHRWQSPYGGMKALSAAGRACPPKPVRGLRAPACRGVGQPPAPRNASSHPSPGDDELDLGAFLRDFSRCHPRWRWRCAQGVVGGQEGRLASQPQADPPPVSQQSPSIAAVSRLSPLLRPRTTPCHLEPTNRAERRKDVT
jgi:hypothetical protein